MTFISGLSKVHDICFHLIWRQVEQRRNWLAIVRWRGDYRSITSILHKQQAGWLSPWEAIIKAHPKIFSAPGLLGVWRNLETFYREVFMSSETPFLPVPTRDLTCHADTLLSPGLSALGAHMGAPCSWSTEQIFWGGPSWGQCESTWWVPRYFNFSIISPTLAPMSWIMKFDLVLTTTNRG